MQRTKRMAMTATDELIGGSSSSTTPPAAAAAVHAAKRSPKIRCSWAGSDPLYVSYHDEEWGRPVHDDKVLFEFLILEGAQAGLSWLTILKRREHYRKAFCHFDPQKVAEMTEKDIERLLGPESLIIKHRGKVTSTIENAKVFTSIQAEFGSFDRFIWGFVNDKPVKGKFTTLSNVPSNTDISEQISKELKQRGMKFVGPKIMYAFMQACGLVNDHVVDCFCYEEED